MTPEAEQYLATARQHLADAKKIASFQISSVAAREDYLAGYHAAEACIAERTGKTAKTHSGLRSEFAQLTKDEPRIDRKFVKFLAQAYELKSLADYGTGSSKPISAEDARAAIETAENFVDCITKLLSSP